jgi:hypothetical protein
LFEAARLFKVCRRRLFRSLGVRLIKSGAVNETGDRTQRGSTPRLELLSFPTPTLTFIALGPIDILGTGRVGMAVAAIFPYRQDLVPIQMPYKTAFFENGRCTGWEYID